MRIKSKPQGKTESNAAKDEIDNKDMKKSYGKYERKYKVEKRRKRKKY